MWKSFSVSPRLQVPAEQVPPVSLCGPLRASAENGLDERKAAQLIRLRRVVRVPVTTLVALMNVPVAHFGALSGSRNLSCILGT